MRRYSLRWRLVLCRMTIVAATLLSGVAMADGPSHLLRSSHDRIVYSEVLADYTQRQAAVPLHYDFLGVTLLVGGEKRSYKLYSQTWPEQPGATPAEWTHQVDIYIPDAAKPGKALLVINNGVNHPLGTRPPSPPTDFNATVAFDIARAAQTIVISMSDAPNQFVTLPGDTVPKTEDDLIAATWRRFLDDPTHNLSLPAHVPMAEAAIKTMDLAERELAPWNVHSFVVTGASKRAWAAWLATIADSRIEALVSFVIDIRIKKLMDHMERVYGGAWPVAIYPYIQEGITQRSDEPAFADLMQIEDAFEYLRTRHQIRLGVPKVLASASGDEFFPPDAHRLYIDDLPGRTALRVAPNANHGGIRRHMAEVLVPTLNRLHDNRALPWTHARLNGEGAQLEISAEFSEPLVSAKLWQAQNPTDRDFRFACGIRYAETPLEVDGKRVRATLDKPLAGWAAAFVEVKFADGFVATTPAYVYPDNVYPLQPPPNGAGACFTVPD